MTTDPTNHRLAGQSWLDNAIDWYGQIDDSDPWEKTTASALIAGAFFLAARDGDDPLDREEQHQSEKFEATYLTPRRELDEDNPDTLVGDAGLAEAPKGWHGFDDPPEPQEIGAGFVTTREDEDEADTIARPLSSGGRVDFYGQTTPWGAA